MTLPVLNLKSPIAEIKQGPGGKLFAYIISPWNSFFQQLVQAPPVVASVDIASDETFTPNTNGTLIVTGGVISNISLIRGSVSINMTGERVIPLSINDSVAITYSVAPTLQFLGA